MSKSIKKVELAADEGVVDLRSKDRLQAGFKVHKIEDNKLEISPAVEDLSFRSQNHTGEAQSPKHLDPDEINRRMESFAEKLEKVVVKVAPAEQKDEASAAKDLIKVKFVKFVQLVASRDFMSVLEKNQDEDIIISSNLLTDLAGAVDQKTGDKKIPIIFIVGLAIGVVLTYFLFRR